MIIYKSIVDGKLYPIWFQISENQLIVGIQDEEDYIIKLFDGFFVDQFDLIFELDNEFAERELERDNKNV